MAKDPAVLFYTSDFLTGTMLLTYEQKGKFITLLCLQHQKDLLSEKDMLNICGTYDKDIFDKFLLKDGFYYNERMRNEKEKRTKYCQSRRENKLKGNENQIVKPKKERRTYVKHMENEIENINEDKDSKLKGLIFPFDSLNFMNVWQVLIKEKKWERKSKNSLQASLKTLSKYPEQEAIQMMENTIAGEWQGLFPLSNKQLNNGKPNNKITAEGLSEALKRELEKRS